MKPTYLVLIFLLIIGLTGAILLTDTDKDKFTGDRQTVIVYKSPTCGCCVGWSRAIGKEGFNVDIRAIEDMASIKEQYGIPLDKQSCHTAVIGDYVIEGHVPIEAVQKLLAEQPDIDGIGLPGMPSGTPGMFGPKREPYEIYQKIGDSFSSFVII